MAKTAKPTDQFANLPKPDGIELGPKFEKPTDRGVVFDRGSISEGARVAFPKAICRNDAAAIEFHDPSWGQSLKGQIPARAIC